MACGVVCCYGWFLFYKKEIPLSSQHSIICTTTFIADVVQHIGAPYIAIKTLMGPGIDPHLYRARESDILMLSHATLIFYHGLHLEGKLSYIFERMNRYIPTVAVTKDIPLNFLIASEFDGIYDPHVWHDVSLWRMIIPTITKALCENDPSHADYYQRKAKLYYNKLTLLHAWVQKQIATIAKSKRILVTAHDAFSYFGRAYGMKVVGLQGISTDAQVSISDITNAADCIIENNIGALFLESSIPSQGIQAVQRVVLGYGKQVKIASELFSDSLGDQSTTAATYCDMIRYNVAVITAALTTEI